MSDSHHDLRTFTAATSSARAKAFGELEGLFSPESWTWKIAREGALFSGGGRALMLQFAHPAVAAGVRQHSTFQQDLVGRTQRTFIPVYQVLFGTMTEAFQAAEKIHRRHETVRGTYAATPRTGPDNATPFAYRANDPSLLLWVHATLVETTLQCYQLMVAPLPRRACEAFYDESRLSGQMFGIPLGDIPETLHHFEQYFHDMICYTLKVGDDAATLYRVLFTPPPFFGAALWLYRLMTAGLLPPSLRTAYGIVWHRREQIAFDALMRSVRLAIPAIPESMRYAPAYYEARARLLNAKGMQPSASSRALHGMSRSIIDGSILMYLRHASTSSQT